MQPITQQNVRLLIPGKAAGVASLIAKHTGMTPKEALLCFYHSPLYEQLEREKTKVWHYSPAQLYILFCDLYNLEQEQKQDRNDTNGC